MVILIQRNLFGTGNKFRRLVVLMLVGEEKTFGFSYIYNSDDVHPRITSITEGMFWYFV